MYVAVGTRLSRQMLETYFTNRMHVFPFLTLCGTAELHQSVVKHSATE